MKDYLESENIRNKANAGLYEQLIKRAFGDCSVMVGHHIAMEFAGDLSTENEIPAADTLIFDHDLMTRIFGDAAIGIMQQVVAVPCSERERLLASYLDEFEAGERFYPKPAA
jgi:hypothetical protein